MRRFLLLALVATACGSAGEPAPVPTTRMPPPVTGAPATTVAESPSGVLSLQLGEWTALGVSDYDFEYVLERDGGADSGTYRAEVRDGEPVNCYLDGALSMRIECDPEYYTIESLFDRLIFGDVRDATVTYDPEWHFPAEIDHRLRSDIGSPYRLEMVAFTRRDPIDWVAFVADAVDWLEANYAGDADVVWEELREDALALVTANPRLTNAYLGLERATVAARGSWFRTPREVALDASQSHDVVVPSGEAPAGELLDDVGYLVTYGAFPDQAGSYAASVHRLIADLDAASPCGWVIDLRPPRFADVARDLLAYGPLLGEGASVSIVVGSDEDVYRYAGGAVTVNGTPAADVYAADGRDPSGLESLNGHPTPNPAAPVAVLSSIQTSHWPLAAFAGLDNSRVFGEPAQGAHPLLAEGETAQLDLPLGGRLYTRLAPPEIASPGGDFDPRPDELVLPRPDSDDDEVLEAALAWLDSHPACA